MTDESFLTMVENSNKDLLSIEYNLTNAIGNYYTEALLFGQRKTDERDGLWTSIKKFFAKLIAGFQEFNRKVIIEIQYRVKRLITKFSTRSTYKKAVKARNEGKEVVEVYNCARMVNVYNKTIAELTPIMNRISKNTYKTIDDMDDEIEEFERKVNETYSIIDELQQTKIKVEITEYIHFLEREISGNSDVFKSLSLCERELQLMESETMKLKTRRDIIGPDVLTKRVGIIKRISMGITQFIKNCFTKLILFINIF